MAKEQEARALNARQEGTVKSGDRFVLKALDELSKVPQLDAALLKETLMDLEDELDADVPMPIGSARKVLPFLKKISEKISGLSSQDQRTQGPRLEMLIEDLEQHVSSESKAREVAGQALVTARQESDKSSAKKAEELRNMINLAPDDWISKAKKGGKGVGGSIAGL